MVDLSFPHAMVGREDELKELQSHLERVKDGQGSTVLISGEAGIGKTRLVHELKEIAQAKGFQILLGNSMFESLTPFMPILEALRSVGLESLFADEAPKVEVVYLVTHSGLLIKEVMRQESTLNPNIFAAMLTTVSDFVKESLSMLTGEKQEGMLNTLGYENFRILIESGKSANLAVIISGNENEFLINDMKEISLTANKNYGDLLEQWDGDDASVKGIESLIDPLITSGKYDGIDYANDDPKIKRNMLFENILLGLVRHTKVNPSVLCIEDLQWADSSTLALIHYVARNTRDCNLLVLGTYRPEDIIEIPGEKVHHLVESMQLMNREDIYDMIELERLDEGYIDDMLTSLLGITSFSDEFKAQIYKETEGNPFFIVSLIRMMIDEKTIEKKDDAWVLVKDLKEANMPSKMQDVIVRRLNRVKEDERRILDYASVIGNEFKSMILAEAIGEKKVRLLEHLRSLEQNHKLIRSFDTKYKFDHAKIKEVLYNKIPTELRMEYHALIAEALETINKEDLEGVLGELAIHYYHCQNNEKALPYLIKSAKQATSKYATNEAFEYYRFALNAVEAMEDSLYNKKKELEILMALGDNCYVRGEWDNALSYFHRAIKLSEKVDDEKCKAEGYRNIGLIHTNRNEWEDAKLYLNKGIKLSEKIDDYQITANIYYCLGSVSDKTGELNDAKKYFGKCMEIAVNIGESSEIADAYLGMGRLYVRKGEYEESIKVFEKAVEILEKILNLGELAKAYVNLGASYSKVSELDEAIKYQKKSIEIADKIRDIRIKGYALMNTSNNYIKKNDLPTAISYLDKALEIFEKLGERLAISTCYENYGSINRNQKKWDKATDYFERALTICMDLDAPYYGGDVLFEYGIMFKDKGETAEARERLEKALDIFKNLQNKQKVEKVQKELSTL